MMPRTNWTAEDQLAVSALPIRIAWAMDSENTADFLDCFINDCIIDYGAAGTITGASAAEEWFRLRRGNRGPTMHHISNILVTSSDYSIDVRSYVNATVQARDETEASALSVGVYLDTVVQVKQEFRVAARRFVSQGSIVVPTTA